MSTNFLSDGFSLEDTSDTTIPTFINQEDESEPPFKVEVRILPIKEYRSIFAKLQRNEGGFRQNNSTQDKVDRDYLRRVIAGWSGLTVKNWNAITRDGKKLTVDPAVVEKLRKEGKVPTIEYSEDRAFYLYRNTWPQDFGNKIFDVVQAGAAEQEAVEEDLKS